jgi:predicted TPR repeat methyltransferase
VRHIILAAAAAREAGLRDDEDRHMAHGLSILSHLDLSDFIRADVQADLLINAGIRHKARGEKKDAARYFRAALEVHPDDGHALVQLASLSDEHAASVTALSDEYVAGLFDGYSDRFEIVADAIDRQWEKSHIDGDVLILDLGVGTGLLGQLLRERITTGADATCASTNDNGRGNVVIRGADLSTRMVDISRARTTTDGAQNKISVYDIVEVSDATAFLRGIGTSSVDIITASDVFIYIGALDEVFLETARVLKKDGLLGFTVELPLSNKKGRNTDRAGAGGLILLQSGRFGHSKAYVEAVADRAGLTLVEWKEEVLRKQGKEDVLGAVVLLQFLSSKT